MITLKSVVKVKGTTAKDLYHFMLICDDEAYNQWWEGTHLRWTTVKRFPDHIGNIIYSEQILCGHMDIGGCVIRRLTPHREMLYQIRRGNFNLPVWLTLKFTDIPGGTEIQHIVEAGYKGILGFIFNPIFKSAMNERYDAIMDDHVHEEFHRLARLLKSDQSPLKTRKLQLA